MALVLAVLPVLAACGRSDLYGNPFGNESTLSSGGFNNSSGGISTASGSSQSATSAGFQSNGTNGTVGTGSTSAGQGPGGSTSDVGSANSGVGASTSGGQSTGNGASGGRTSSGTGGSSGVSGTSASSGATGSSGSSGTGGSGATGSGGSGSTTGPSCDETISASARAKCTDDSDCGCPYTCVSDPPFGMDCEPSCLQLSDCTDLSYVCNGTYCQFNTCGPGTNNGSFNSFCDVASTDDGTCVPVEVGGKTIGQCTLGGNSTTCCDSTAGSGDLNSVCAAGLICSGGHDAECGAVCDPKSGFGSCPFGQFCAFELNDSMTGACFGQTSVCTSDGG